MGGCKWFMVLLVAVVAGTAVPAYAQGSLKAGDVLFAANRADGPPMVGRVSAQGTAETIAAVGGETMAVADPNTIYTAETNATQTAFDIWEIDVPSGGVQVVKTIPFANYNWVYNTLYPTVMDLLVDHSSGKILLAVNGGHDNSASGPVYTSRDLLRFHPGGGPVEELFSGPSQVILSGRFGYSYEFDNDGTLILGSIHDGFQRFENGAFVPIWTDPLAKPANGDFDIDPETGDLVFANFYPVVTGPPDSYGITRVNPSASYDSRTLVYDGSGDFANTVWFHKIAVAHDDDVLWGRYGGLSGLKIDRVDAGVQTSEMDEGGSFLLTEIDVVRTECSNGVDDDGDGLVDYRADGSGDPHCGSADDDRELYTPPVQCSTADVRPTAATWLLAIFGLLFGTRFRSGVEKRLL